MRQEVLYRAGLIARGDYFVAEARQLACCYASDRGFLPKILVHDYWRALDKAGIAYRHAGLGWLGGRVAFFARRVAQFGDRENVRDAWEKFDRINAGGCGVI